MASFFPVGFSLIIPTESSFPAQCFTKFGFLLDSPGELLEPTDARTSPQTNRIQISAGKVQVCVAVENLPQRITLCSQG